MISIKNPDKIRPKYLKYYKKVIFFTLNKYFTKSQLKNSNITIILYNQRVIVEGNRSNMEVRGLCVDIGDTDKHKKNIEIVVSVLCINKKARSLYNKLMEPCKTIIHELTHAKQYITGELQDVFYKGKPRTKWLGKLYRNYTKKEFDNGLFLEFPWEIEAFGRAECVYAQFLGKI